MCPFFVVYKSLKKREEEDILRTSEIPSTDVSFENVESHKRNKGNEISACPKCKKQSFRATFNEHPKWVRFCLCCDYKEVNPAYSPFVY